MKQSLLVISFLLSSCVSDFNDKQKIDKGNVNYIEIRKLFDTVSLRLTTEQVTDFIDNWNSSTQKGLYKFLPEYSLTIRFKGDSSLSYSTSSDLIKQRGDWAYSFGNKQYFKNIWFKQAGLTDDYFEYLPTFYNNDEGKFSTDRNPLTDKHRKAIKQVLTYYKHTWKDIRGEIFYQGKIDNELLWNYTTKANDSIWLSSYQ